MAKTKKSVFDAGPFIHLQEIKKLDILRVFEKILTTQEILDECKKIEYLLKKLKNLEKKELAPNSKDLVKYLVERYEIDLGESTGIALCKQEHVRLIFTDDLEARQVSHMLGFEPHGTIAIITRAFREKLLTKKETKNAIEMLYAHSTLFLTKDLKELAIKEIERFKKD